MELDPRSTAVIAIHLQHDISGQDGAFASFFAEQITARDVLANCRRLTEAARDAGALVVFTQISFAPDYSNLNANSPLLQLVPQLGSLQDGSVGASLLEEAGVQEQDLVHNNQRIGGFDAELEQTFRDRGITSVLVCGVATNASVETTARQLSEAGFAVRVVDEACSASTEEVRRASMDSLGLVAGACSLEEALQALNGA